VPRILWRGDYDDYARRSGVNISVGTGDLGGSQWEGITGQPRWAAADNCDSRTDRDYAERASPSINPQVGLHRKRFAGSWWTRRGLLKQYLANFLRVHRCVEHFCVTLELLWIFLVRLNQSFPLATARSGRKQRV